MAQESPFILIKRVEAALVSKLSGIDIYVMDPAERKVITTLKHGLVDSRLDVQDYELSETREEQVRVAKEAMERLEGVGQGILALSHFGILSSADVAIYSAQVEQVKAQLL